jgi:hypothetical protein
MLFGMSRLPFPLAFLVAAACYLPALIIAQRASRELEAAWTDKVQEVQSLVSQAFGTALAGLIYVGAIFTIATATIASTSNT